MPKGHTGIGFVANAIPFTGLACAIGKTNGSHVLQIAEFQARVGKWVAHNFPINHLCHQPLLGVGEEVGELMHAHLKLEQGIRGTAEEHRAAMKDAVGDIMVYLADYCTQMQLNMAECVEVALTEIEKRDWIKFPKNGRTE